MEGPGTTVDQPETKYWKLHELQIAITQPKISASEMQFNSNPMHVRRELTQLGICRFRPLCMHACMHALQKQGCCSIAKYLVTTVALVGCWNT